MQIKETNFNFKKPKSGKVINMITYCPARNCSVSFTISKLNRLMSWVNSVRLVKVASKDLIIHFGLKVKKVTGFESLLAR